MDPNIQDIIRKTLKDFVKYRWKAKKWNFFLRGFKYLIIAKKPDGQGSKNKRATKVNWQRYK